MTALRSFVPSLHRPSRLRSPASARGFTLHDALVAMAVITITTTIGVPALRSLLAKSQVVTAANTLVAALQLARSEAIMRNVRVTLCPSPDGRACHTGRDEAKWHLGYLIYVDENENHEQDPTEPVVRVFDVMGNVRVYGSGARDTITYHPAGDAAGSDVKLLVCDPSALTPPRWVILSNTGRPKIVMANDSCENHSI